MRYLLVVITHGESPRLGDAISAFRAHAAPYPAHALLWVDGPDVGDAAYNVAARNGIHDWTLDGSSRQRGFCATYADAWQEAVFEASRLECDYVFWLESDFLLTRPVDLRALAELLRSEPELAQVAFMRNAVNEQEIAAGGLFQSRPGEYEARSISVVQQPVVNGARIRAYPWLRHGSYFTTNPNLMTVDFMRSHPWPSYPSECEGLFTHDLLAEGLRFAVWGDGAPWTEHVGVRTGFGY
jgi:hypothetical protein